MKIIAAKITRSRDKTSSGADNKTARNKRERARINGRNLKKLLTVGEEKKIKNNQITKIRLIYVKLRFLLRGKITKNLVLKNLKKIFSLKSM